ncbi:MAG: CAAX prenyl protease-related protein [Verrucomicrobiales bacterium]|nr:CAAX prenyl protease-related protein [Verrucomicrobiales bacterium]
MSKLEKALVVPFAVFIGLLALELVPLTARVDARYVVYPLQTLVCAGLLWRYWRFYQFNGIKNVGFTVGIGVLVFVLWIAPQVFLGVAPRVAGFNPNVLAEAPLLYWGNLTMRFLRLVVVVPLIEELFWRGFLLRYLIGSPVDKIPFGKFTWWSFLLVSVGFMLEHQGADYAAALVTGALYNWVAYRTKSQGSCVLAHAVTNLLLGIYIMVSGQWGFW